MKAVEAIEAIKDAMGQEYPHKEKINKVVSEVSKEEQNEVPIERPREGGRVQYFDEGDLPEERVPMERVLTDRAKMLDVVRQFYISHSSSFEELDDFATLFAVYCNHYIRFNLHQAIPDENDFGITALWDVVKDEKQRKCFTLLQRGIFNDVFDNVDVFHDAKNLYNFSVINLYLFIYHVTERGKIQESETDEATKAKIQEEYENLATECFANMNKGMQDYSVGGSSYMRIMKYGDDGCDPNPLPYILSELQTEFISSYILKPVKSVIKLFFPHFGGRTEPVSLLKSNKLQDRLVYLHIPNKVSFRRNILADKMRVLIERDKALKSKNEIIRDFSHTYKNMKANTLYTIAQTLLGRDDVEDRENGRKLLFEYEQKESLSKSVYMMQLRYEDNGDRLRELIQDSIADPEDEYETPRDIVNSALMQCVINAFYDTNRLDPRIMRKNLQHIWPTDHIIKNHLIFDEQMKRFEEQVISQGMECLNWLQDESMQLEFEADSVWQQIALYQADYATVFLKELFVELFMNMFKYGDLQRPVVLHLFCKDDDRICIVLSNYHKEGGEEKSGSKWGIQSLERTVKMLYKEKLQEPCMFIDNDGDKFTAEVDLPKELFI